MTSRISKTSFNRRHFVTLCGAGVLMPQMAGAQALPTNPDVVIIGAGAAGIAAAHEMRKAGYSFVHLEAGNRIGGRAFTETETFGVPFDHGAHWVQNTDANPYYARANNSGNRFYLSPENYGIYSLTGKASEDQENNLWAAWEKVAGAMSSAGRTGQDVAPADVAPSDGPWDKTAWFGIGPWEMGKDMEDFSCADWWNSADSTDYYYADGYGRLVADHAAGLTIALNTPATHIRWGGDGVEVETPRGTIRARAVILTVSTGVLAAGGITFDPALPTDKQESFDAIRMGDYNHITLRFSEDIFGLGQDGYILHQVADGREGFGALTNASGTGLAYCDLGGSFALEMEQAGEAAAIDFVQGLLRGMIGKDADTYFMGAHATMWSSDPLFRGCYASAQPGKTAMRKVLQRTEADRLFFAGEACHSSLWATVGGADLSGAEAARQVARVLG